MTRKLLWKAGERVEGTVVRVFAVVRNTDDQEGRGADYDSSYHMTQNEAQAVAKGKGVFGSDADVAERMLLQLDPEGRREPMPFSDPARCLLLPDHFSEIRDATADIEKRRAELLKGLSKSDRAILGLPDP